MRETNRIRRAYFNQVRYLKRKNEIITKTSTNFKMSKDNIIFLIYIEYCFIYNFYTY